MRHTTFSNRNSVFMLSSALLLLLAFLFAAYIGITLQLTQSNYSVEKLSADIQAAEEESVALQIKMSESASLEYILERTNNLSYTEIEQVSYVKKPTQSPVASR